MIRGTTSSVLNWETLEASMDFLSSCGKLEVGGKERKTCRKM
jgi:hypothetical protein